ncbi:MAG: hypothetical protein A3C02_01865 [Candidatus Andersenbacteria bacterium RIFCSPHIGHO2_02_FULL_45_11]|uniref:Pilus assembly protein PilO n=1 Tax=Candidatus Andersenbacteria bacterium RIFCSPHIGHO2_12_FULL_45_11 TaxID=1797281 RepID=A0A1G1X575_9BACT|nr:MAG: hypothetical protein A2805_01380 [Candidatus Andersenbacteria bacterium RIFCSPHIGHO2_01_FULL_46_36]OGY32932.1 MAG: hypothetical protein A3C02_01865 [Candidatus Andersenbacteria bacterium RIFCSPHIGHO2_02_FULL_45_11]OGY34720.1 MAG: hypothetical protein A3D99_05295 [Candidatus Andersenbacteria bacterium RIFCSPHIGHO2_12_FULL_45_11]
MAINTSLNTPYLVLTGVVVIAIAFLFTVLQPLMDSISTAKSSIESNTSSLAEKEAFLQSLDAKINQLRSQPDIERQLAAVIPETERSQDIIRVVDQYAKESGVTLTAITNNASQTKARANASKARGDLNLVPEGIQIITLQLGVSGNYQQVRAFLAGLEKSPRIVDVARITISKVPEQPEAVTASLVIQLYARAEETPSS